MSSWEGSTQKVFKNLKAQRHGKIYSWIVVLKRVKQAPLFP